MISPKRIDGCALWQMPSIPCHCAARVVASVLSCIGSHVPLVKAVCLDLEGVCRTRCWIYSYSSNGLLHGTTRESPVLAELDFTGFLKAVWQYGLRAKLEVVHVESRQIPEDEYYAALEIRHISSTVQALCNDDIDLGRFSQTVYQIALQHHGHSGKVLFTGTTIQGDDNSQEDFGRDVARVRWPKDPNGNPRCETEIAFLLDSKGTLQLRPKSAPDILTETGSSTAYHGRSGRAADDM
jgi:hypothetical protein